MSENKKRESITFCTVNCIVHLSLGLRGFFFFLECLKPQTNITGNGDEKKCGIRLRHWLRFDAGSVCVVVAHNCSVIRTIQSQFIFSLFLASFFYVLSLLFLRNSVSVLQNFLFVVPNSGSRREKNRSRLLLSYFCRLCFFFVGSLIFYLLCVGRFNSNAHNTNYTRIHSKSDIVESVNRNEKKHRRRPKVCMDGLLVAFDDQNTEKCFSFSSILLFLLSLALFGRWLFVESTNKILFSVFVLVALFTSQF